jgi:uncharacterized protein YbjQ (UPF0145 family)
VSEPPAASPFSSTLSVAEFAFATEVSLEPIAAVHGCQVRWLSQALPVPNLPRNLPRAPVAKVTPVGKLDSEITYVRREVLAQLARQAAKAGADAVIGIHQLPGVIDWEDMSGALGRRARSPGPGSPPYLVRGLEYQLIGTAVRDPADRADQPRLSTLSAADTWKLRRRGWRTAGLAAACSYQFCIGGGMRAGYVASEIDQATAVWSTARQVAFDRLREEATGLEAGGVVGVDIQVERRRAPAPPAPGRAARRRQPDRHGHRPACRSRRGRPRSSGPDHFAAMSADAPPFTSDLSVDELVLLDDAGWEPLEIVCGDCTYNPGRQASSRARSKELNWITGALTSGQALAVRRMRENAAKAGGEGVVGVRLAVVDDDLGGLAGPRHFTALGTAVCRRGARSRRRGEPFTCHLSGQEAFLLMSAGWQPLGLVFGMSVYHSKSERRRRRDFSEMGALTDAFSSARELAIGRMQAQAKPLKATGIVGVSIDMKITDGPTVRFTAIGTAIAPGKDGPGPPDPRVAVPLVDVFPR